MSQKDIIWEEMTLGHKIKCESKGRDKWWHFTLFVLSSLLIFSIRLSNNIVIWFPNTTCFRWINDIFPWFPSFYSGMGSYFSHCIIWLGWKSSKERKEMRIDTFPWSGWMTLTYNVFGPIILDYRPENFLLAFLRFKRPHFNYACSKERVGRDDRLHLSILFFHLKTR